ncbi:acyl-CoA dehydrogenase family protein [Hyalangium sp.]|uniref:acyl-CoA dehydrogenase family protein n=1 Tax=Hyalangium sp. TaxID=2028555 RepID=UPI002D3C282F|nr:acyl-CoA dehydrogenase family protein [Hyalangium sp.]HYH97662.1 acyl-CoA dehydrogenase family protein [Hyalangium sp.]
MQAPAITQLHERSTPEEVRRYVASELEAFFATQINPEATERDEACEAVPRGAFEHAAQVGLLNYLMPKDVGGMGGSRRTFGLLLEHIGYFCNDMAFPSMLAMYADVPNVIYRSRRPSLLEAYVHPMALGKKLGTFAYTDYGDAFDFQTRVVRKEDRYVLNGTKCLQTGGALADVFVTYARDEADDMKVLLVDRSDPGVSTRPVKTLGLRSAGLTQLKLEDVTLAEERLLSGPDGLAEAQTFLNSRRMFVVCPFVGAMKRIIELCVVHLDTVIREGRPLTQAQTVQAHVGNMAARQLTSEAILHDALDRIGRGDINQLFDPIISAAKLIITENALELGERAIRLTGWRGYSKELPFERFYRAFMAALTGQTAQDVLEIQLGVVTMAHVGFNQQRGLR